MKPPKELPSTLAALGEAYARRCGIDPGDFWAYVYRKAVPPPEVRAAIVDAFFPRVQPSDFLGLRSLATHATLATSMQAPDKETRQTRVSRARLRKENRRHPFVAALVEQGKTVTEFARELGYPRATVQSWYDGDADNARPIPMKAARAIEEALGVPVSAWRRTVE